MDKEIMAKAREAFIKNVINLYKQGTITKDQALDVVDKQGIPMDEEEKKLFKSQIKALLG